MSETKEEKNTIHQLTRIQRRVLGTLMEKGFTTPDQYPMTLKGVTTGCNQKSNRDPITEYAESDVADALESLRQLGLVAEVFTDGGRAARYRHYARHKFDFTETQFAIICELLLRGRQQPGELRTRASRMVRIESQDQLKSDLQSLQAKSYIQSSGALERRGVEVDHTFYLPKENMTLAADARLETADSEQSDATGASVPTGSPSSTMTAPPTAAGQTLEPGLLHALQSQIKDLQAQLASVESSMMSVEQRLERIERDLGV